MSALMPPYHLRHMQNVAYENFSTMPPSKSGFDCECAVFCMQLILIGLIRRLILTATINSHVVTMHHSFQTTAQFCFPLIHVLLFWVENYSLSFISLRLKLAEILGKCSPTTTVDYCWH